MSVYKTHKRCLRCWHRLYYCSSMPCSICLNKSCTNYLRGYIYGVESWRSWIFFLEKVSQDRTGKVFTKWDIPFSYTKHSKIRALLQRITNIFK